MTSLPTLPKLPRLGRGPAPAAKKPRKRVDRRKTGRITIQELNAAGAEALKAKVAEVTKPEDRRPAWVKVLDVIDLPRNIIGNIIGELAGVEKGKLPRGALGLPKVFMSDVLKKLGVENRVVRGIAGFAGDVAIDPLTYLTTAAVTGLRIAKAVPKIAKPGTEALKAVARTGRMTPEIAKGLGLKAVTPARIVRRAAIAAKAVAGKKVGKFVELPMEVARAKRIQQFVQRSGKPLAKQIDKLRAAGKESAAVALEKIVARRAYKLMGRRGGLLTQRLAKAATRPLSKTARAEQIVRGAREWIQKYGLKGRPIARIPFTQAAITATKGRQAQLYKEILDPEVIKRLMRTGKLREVIAKRARQLALTKEAAQGVRQVDRELRALQKVRKAVVKARKGEEALEQLGRKFEITPKARKLLGEVTSKAAAAGEITQIDQQIDEKAKALAGMISEAMGKPTELPKGVLARGRLAKVAQKAQLEKAAAKERGLGISRGALAAELTDPGAPAPIRALAEAEFGRTLAPRPGAGRLERLGERLQRGKQAVFGPGASPTHQREVAIHQRFFSGASSSGYREGRRFQKEAAPVLANWAKKTGGTQDDIASTIVDLIESDHGRNLGKWHAGDPIHESIRLAKESGLADAPEVKAIVDRYRGIQDDLLRQVDAMGVAPGEMSDYYHRMGTDEFRRSAAAQKARFPTKPYAKPRVQRAVILDAQGNPLFDKPMITTGLDAEFIAKYKKLGHKVEYSDISQAQWNLWGRTKHAPGSSLAEPDFLGAQFSNDIARSLADSVRRTDQLKAAAEVRNLAMETGAKLPERMVRGMPQFAGMGQPVIPKDSPFYHTIGRQLEGYSFPRPVADMLTRFFKFSAQKEQVGAVLRLSDRIFGYWKGQALMHPAYTARNVFQNLFGGLMAGANPIDVGRLSFNKQLRNISRAVEEGRTLTGTILIQGREVPVSVFMRSGKMYNMFNAGFSSQLMSSELLGKTPGYLSRSAMLRAKGRADDVFLTWHRWNNRVETNMRLATWMHFMETGMTPRQAAMRTIMAMPDLSDISLWERNIAARIFPWYRWMRRNGALQAHYLLTKPAFFAGQTKLQRALEASMVEQPVRADLRPEWMQEQLAAQISGTEEQGQVWLLASWLPFQELGKVAAGTMDIGDAARLGLESMRPEIKFAAEVGVGADIFKQRPIEPLTMQDMVTKGYKALAAKMGTPLDNLLQIRVVKEVGRVAELYPEPAAMARRAMLGGAIQRVSEERGLGDAYRRLTEQARELRRRINLARRLGDKTEVRTLTNQFIATLRRMHELGLPGVPKATQAMFREQGIEAGAPAFESQR